MSKNNYSYSKRHQKCYLKVPLQHHKIQISNSRTHSSLFNKKGCWNWQPHRGNHNVHVQKFSIPEVSFILLTDLLCKLAGFWIKQNASNKHAVTTCCQIIFKCSWSIHILTAAISFSQMPLTIWLTANKILTLTICVCCRSTARCRAVCWLTFWISRLALPCKIFKALEHYHPSNSSTRKAVH